MANEIKIFSNPQFGEIRTAGTSDEPLFCLTDVCRAIGIVNARDVKSRLDEDDVVQTDTIDRLGRVQQTTFITEGGLYDTIIRSDSEKAKPFRKWVTHEVLPALRKTGSYSIRSGYSQERIGLKEKLSWCKEVKKMLNLNDSSTLSLLQKIAEPYALPLPDYTPSKGILKSATELLEKFGYRGKMNAQEFNELAIKGGFLVEMERNTTGGQRKKFKSITKKGLNYGENQAHPKNPKSTQPLWYEDKFAELLGVLQTLC